MNRQVQISGLYFRFDTLFQCFRVANDAAKSAHRQVLMNQRFSLIALEFGGVFRVPLEVPPLQQGPVDLVQIGKVSVKVCPLVVGVAIGK